MGNQPGLIVPPSLISQHSSPAPYLDNDQRDFSKYLIRCLTASLLCEIVDLQNKTEQEAKCAEYQAMYPFFRPLRAQASAPSSSPPFLVVEFTNYLAIAIRSPLGWMQKIATLDSTLTGESMFRDIHLGFYEASCSVPLGSILSYAKHIGKGILFTGHSLGGAIAEMCYRRLYGLGLRRDFLCICFGSPSITKEPNQFPSSPVFRYLFLDDPIPFLLAKSGFKFSGRCLLLDDSGSPYSVKEAKSVTDYKVPENVPEFLKVLDEKKWAMYRYMTALRGETALKWTGELEPLTELKFGKTNLTTVSECFPSTVQLEAQLESPSLIKISFSSIANGGGTCALPTKLSLEVDVGQPDQPDMKTYESRYFSKNEELKKSKSITTLTVSFSLKDAKIASEGLTMKLYDGLSSSTLTGKVRFRTVYVMGQIGAGKTQLLTSLRILAQFGPDSKEFNSIPPNEENCLASLKEEEVPISGVFFRELLGLKFDEKEERVHFGKAFDKNPPCCILFVINPLTKVIADSQEKKGLPALVKEIRNFIQEKKEEREKAKQDDKKQEKDSSELADLPLCNICFAFTFWAKVDVARRDAICKDLRKTFEIQSHEKVFLVNSAVTDHVKEIIGVKELLDYLKGAIESAPPFQPSHWPFYRSISRLMWDYRKWIAGGGGALAVGSVVTAIELH